MMIDKEIEERALGVLWGLAVGDALGMPTQDLSPSTIQADYGTIEQLIPAGKHQLIAAHAPAGMITDDTEQALILARLLADEGYIEPARFAQQMLDWEQDIIRRGSLDLLGPSTKTALERIRAGADPIDAGKNGSTNGAAMRIGPIGIAFPIHSLEKFVEHVIQASQITHGTSVALAGASLVGAVVSAGLQGENLDTSLRIGFEAARLASCRGHQVTAPDIVERTRWAIKYLSGSSDRIHDLFNIVGTSMATHESVVAAVAITALEIPAWDALCLAASAGGDTDTIAAMVGMMRGASEGVSAWPQSAITLVAQQNNLDMTGLVRNLLALRFHQ